MRTIKKYLYIPKSIYVMRTACEVDSLQQKTKDLLLLNKILDVLPLANRCQSAFSIK